ncbi:MAG: hypothetical protein K8R92_11235 [Planctomycetes bacterium]|nr:hypothetical protein [Planctomycetota bacterium]
MPSTASDIARAVVQQHDGDKIILSIPSTEYQLHLTCNGKTNVHPGKRIQGVIELKALRMHKASAGGSFIEPIYGHPRIVQGRVLSIDLGKNRLLCDVVVPVWVEPFDGQSAADFNAGDMVNFYVQSGATFTPVA